MQPSVGWDLNTHTSPVTGATTHCAALQHTPLQTHSILTLGTSSMLQANTQHILRPHCDARIITNCSLNIFASSANCHILRSKAEVTILTQVWFITSIWLIPRASSSAAVAGSSPALAAPGSAVARYCNNQPPPAATCHTPTGTQPHCTNLPPPAPAPPPPGPDPAPPHLCPRLWLLVLVAGWCSLGGWPGRCWWHRVQASPLSLCWLILRAEAAAPAPPPRHQQLQLTAARGAAPRPRPHRPSLPHTHSILYLVHNMWCDKPTHSHI